MKTRHLVVGLAVAGLNLLATPLQAQLTEDFEGTFPAWESGWFGTNSDALNVYCVSRGCSQRGNNPDGLWIKGPGDTESGPVFITFNDVFGASIQSFSLDVAGYSTTNLFALDMNGNEIFNTAVTLTFDGTSDPGTYSRYTINSTNGIKSFGFTGSAVGNTSIDNLEINASPTSVVPEPSSVALLAAGLAGITGISRMRRRNAVVS